MPLVRSGTAPVGVPAARPTLLLVLLVLLVLLAGCGESGPRDDGVGEPVAPESVAVEDLPPVPPGTRVLRTAVRTYGDALLTGEARAAYALFTDECRERVALTSFETLAQRAGELYGEPLPFASYDEDVRGSGVGATAEVDYSFRRADGLVQTDEAWELTEEGWRLADC